MTEPCFFLMPTFAELQDADAGAFALSLDPQTRVPIERVRLDQGVAMSARHECFSVCFALPAGLSLDQAVYRVFGPAQQEWVMMMTPVMPEPDGRYVLQAVVHRECAAAPAPIVA